ncbi:LOW QUALITY PROTEIN: Coiled-coil domain-containing protein 149-A [Frankliniella fusca]|uniref:Coiled-coil domain-containing protein 149-A n=1 Tax=Frankliniella fusca TaxID=407009 RepID=A0AAE1HTJ8_9NEOP|nr:LOW QUALITY PROTEIN: Coiled-coil domain-containing protein 149-A [Frankliniella fusca]
MGTATAEGGMDMDMAAEGDTGMATGEGTAMVVTEAGTVATGAMATGDMATAGMVMGGMVMGVMATGVMATGVMATGTGTAIEGKSTLVCSHGHGPGNELLCVESKNLIQDENKESKHFYEHESYGAKDEKYKKKESLKHAAQEVVDGYTETHKKDKGGSSTGPGLGHSGALVAADTVQAGEDKSQLADEAPTVSAEASNPGASVEDHPVGVGHVASFQQDYHHHHHANLHSQLPTYQPHNEQWIPIRPSSPLAGAGPGPEPAAGEGGASDSGREHDVGHADGHGGQGPLGGHPDALEGTAAPDHGGDSSEGRPLHFDAPASTLPTQVLGISHSYQPLQTFIGEGTGPGQGAKATSSVTMQFGDLTWSSVRGPGPGPGRGRGSHLDGTEDAARLQHNAVGPSGYEVVERPADLSAEVHLTTLSPLSALGATGHAAESSAAAPGPSEEAVALYYQNEDKSEADGDAELVDAPPPPRKRGRVRYGDQLRPGRRRKRPRGPRPQVADDRGQDDDETARSSAEPRGPGAAANQEEDDHDAIGVVKQPSTGADDTEELAQETSKLLDELKESKAVRRRLRQRPRIMTETGHILRGLEVKETLKADKWR